MQFHNGDLRVLNFTSHDGTGTKKPVLAHSPSCIVLTAIHITYLTFTLMLPACLQIRKREWMRPSLPRRLIDLENSVSRGTEGRRTWQRRWGRYRPMCLQKQISSSSGVPSSGSTPLVASRQASPRNHVIIQQLRLPRSSDLRTPRKPKASPSNPYKLRVAELCLCWPSTYRIADNQPRPSSLYIRMPKPDQHHYKAGTQNAQFIYSA